MSFTTSGIELRGKLTANETAETERFLRSGVSQVRIGMRWTYVALIAVFLAWLSFQGAIHGQFLNTFRGLLPLWLLIAGIIALLANQRRRARAKAGKLYNAGAPDRFRLTNSELSWESANGAKGSAPWSTFRGWREGKSVIFVLYPDKVRVMILPKTDLSPMDLEMVRGTLTAALGPAVRK